MIIRRFNTKELVIPVAEVVIKNNKKLFNIVHGMPGKDTWEYRIGLNHRLITNYDATSIELNKNNYILQSIYKNGNRIRDIKGNKLYYINTSPRADMSNKLLLLVNLPEYNNYEVTASEGVELLAMAKERVNGKIIDAPIYYFTKTNTMLTFILDNKIKITFTFNANGEVQSLVKDI